jgi:putative N6-adenine-specific DNA methylase
MPDLTLAAFCAVGAEKVVSNELKKIASNYTILESGYGRVRFMSDLAGVYRALMCLRAADRLLLEAGSFPAGDFDALFEGTRNIAWEDLIPRGMGLVVDKVRVNRSQLKAETSIQAVAHKAAAERLCAHYGIKRLPEAGKSTAMQPPEKLERSEGTAAHLRVHLEKDTAFVLLDLSGEPLFKRGYRPAGGIAPLRETTAAAIILLSGWRRKFPLYDPFCGSATILIEAAMYAWDIAPGLGRNFALSNMGIADKQTEETIRGELAARIDLTRPVSLCGSDADEKAVALAGANLKRALALPGKTAGIPFGGAGLPLPAGVELKRLSMDNAAPTGTAGFIITNPPYGRRIGDTAEAEERYRDMALLCKSFSGWKLALICDHKGFESFFGKKADNCRELRSGAVDTFLYQYETL